MKNFLILSAILMLVSCNSNTEIAASHQWKIGEGTMYLGDWIEFDDKMNDSGFYIGNDTLYDGRIPVALVKDISFYFDHYRMEITSLDGKEEGLYIEKGDAKPTE